MNKVKEELDRIKKEMEIMKENFPGENEKNGKSNILTTKATASLDNDDWDK